MARCLSCSCSPARFTASSLCDFTGQDYVAFTPSRFLMDMACFVSIFAGYAASRLRQKAGMSVAVATVLGIMSDCVNLPNLAANDPRGWRSGRQLGSLPLDCRKHSPGRHRFEYELLGVRRQLAPHSLFSSSDLRAAPFGPCLGNCAQAIAGRYFFARSASSRIGRKSFLRRRLPPISYSGKTATDGLCVEVWPGGGK